MQQELFFNFLAEIFCYSQEDFKNSTKEAYHVYQFAEMFKQFWKHDKSVLYTSRVATLKKQKSTKIINMTDSIWEL